MRILAVDTSSASGSAALAEDGAILAETRLASSLQHSERLFGSVEFLFRFAPFALADVDIFAATRGPGSFTGLRVGLAAMEGFAAACGKPSAGVSTLEALAWRANVAEGLVAPAIDARRGEIYAALYRRSGGHLIEERPPAVLAPEAFLAALPDGPVFFCGDGASRHRALFESAARPGWRVLDVDPYLASTVAELAAAGHCGPLLPLYVRPTEAEVRRK
jgi:tRNA threonylcarbamoyladenosine biosynthesis protein TsaB